MIALLSLSMMAASVPLGVHTACHAEMYNPGKRYSLKELPIDLSVRPPVAVATLRNRTLGPVVQSFIACARETAKSYAVHTSRAVSTTSASLRR